MVCVDFYDPEPYIVRDGGSSVGLKECYWTVDDLVGQEGKESKNLKLEKDELGRKFRKTLEGLGLKEMVNWYRSGFNNNLVGKKQGYYIFSGEDKEAVFKNLSELFSKTIEMEKEVSCENMYRIIDILQELLPWTQDENKIKILLDKQGREIKQFFSMLDEIRKLNIFSQNDGKSKIKKELNKISQKLEEINKSKCIIQSELELPVQEEYKEYIDKQRQIGEQVVSFYLRKMNDTYFNKIKFPNKNNCKDFYKKLYMEVRRWHIKWLCLFNTIDQLQEAENFYNICDLFDDCEKDKNHMEQYFDQSVPMEDKMKEAYNSFHKLHIKLFSEYYEKNYDNEKMQKMICDEADKEKSMEKCDVKSRVGYIEFCNKFVENIGMCKYAENNNEYIVSMKITALKELNILVKRMQDDVNTTIGQEANEIVMGTEDEAVREKFVKYYEKCYEKDHTKEKIKKEFLECIFSLKYYREKTCLDFVPLGKIKDNFWMQPIVSE